MRVSVTCPSCAAKFTVREEFAGKCVHCKKCQKPVNIPDDRPDDVYRGPPLARTGLSSTTIATNTKSPRRKSSKRDNGGIPLGLGLGVGGAVIVGLIVVGVMMQSSSPTLPPPPPARMEAAVTPVQPAPIAMPTAVAATPQPVVSPLQPVQPPVVVNEAPVEPSPPPKTKAKPAPPAEVTLPDLIARVEPAVVRLEVEGEDGGVLGSGYIVHEDGTAVTNYHVISGAKAATAIFADGTKVAVQGYKLVKPRADIAVIKLNLGDKKIEPIPLAEAIPQKGVDVVGFGAPEGLSFTTSTGIISGIRNADVMAEEVGEDLDGTWLQTTCPISHGSSGGPLTDRQGRLVAMNSKVHTTGQNLNFAISAIDIAAAMAEAPPDFKPFIPSDLKEYESSIAKKGLPEEIGTPRGNQLLAGLKSVAVVDPLAVLAELIDPKKLISSRIQARAKGALEHRNIQVVAPGTKVGDGFGLMVVVFDFEDAVRKRSGTQTLVARSALLCRDPEATGRGSKMRIVWKSEEKLGALPIPTLIRGQIPKGFTVEDKLLKLFNRFEAAHRIASTTAEKSDGTKETLAKPGAGSAAPKKTAPGPGF